MSDRTDTREGHVLLHPKGRLHSTGDQPAVVYADGTQWWYCEGKIHRDGAPAVVWANGVEEWWQNGFRTKVVYPNRAPIAPELRGVTQNWHAGRLVSEAVPPRVARYRQLVAAAYKACFS